MPELHELRSAYIPHKRVRVKPVGKSMTKQSLADESNINMIMDRYTKTGIIDHVATYGAHYSEMPTLHDFHEAMTLVTEAQQMFEELPAQTRSDFKNDPAEFLDFVTNPENEAAMIEMGLAAPHPVIEPELPLDAGPGPAPSPEPPAAAPAAPKDPV